MVSYADLVTLLFVFFVVLFAAARIDPEGVGGLARALRTAFRAEVVPPQTRARLDAGLVVRGSGSILPAREDERGIALTLPGEAFFHAGTASLRAESMALLDEVGGFLATLDGAIVVEGHAADRPTGSSLYTTPWELSAARAARIVRHLQESCRLAPSRLSAVGLGVSRPCPPGRIEGEGSAHDRVEIVVAP
jgi:chemotaxis protein MotB